MLQVIDAALARFFGPRIDGLFPPIVGCWVGARAGTQALDIAHGFQTVIEKGLDMKSDAGIAQEDIQTFYDTMQVLRIVRWLGTD